MIDGKLRLLPGRGTDRIRLNASVESVQEIFDLQPWTSTETLSGEDERILYYENEEWEILVYEDDEDEDENEIGIESISCGVYLEYKGENLIGMEIDELERHLGISHDGEAEHVAFDDGHVEIVYQFDDLGIQVWTHHQTNVVITIIIGHIFKNDDEILYLDDPQRVYDGYISEVPEDEA